MILQTADFGEIEVVPGIPGWYDWLVHPKSPRSKELFEASVVLAGRTKTPSYPFRFDEHEINYAKGAQRMSDSKTKAAEMEAEKPKQITIDTVVAAYVKTRAEISAKKKAYEEEEARLKGIQEKRENWLAAQMDATGQTAAKTDHGTCYFTRKESVTIVDWDAFLAYIVEHEAYELLEHRVAKNAALEIMGDDRDKLPPPGTNYVGLRAVNVRKN